MIGSILSSAAATWLAGAVPRLACLILSLFGRAPVADRPPSPWLAGSTRRWHTNPAFSETGDRVDGHSCRVAILILQLWPDAPVELLRAAIIHDLGENSVGDLASPVKWQNPDLYAALERLEAGALQAMGFQHPAQELDAVGREKLHLCDGLDAFLWAVTHRPAYVRARTDWRAMFARLQASADALGVSRKFNEIVEGVCDGKF